MKRRGFIASAGAAGASAIFGPVFAQATTLRVGDQKGGVKALLEAAGGLKDLPYRVEWSEFPAAAPLLEALNAGAIDSGYCGDAPFTFAAAAGVPVKAISAVRSQQGGLAILVPKDSPVQTLEQLKGKKIGTGKGSIGHQLVLAALEKAKLTKDAVQLVFLPPADAKAAFVGGTIDAWSTWEPYVAQEEIYANARRVITGVGLTPGLGFQVARHDAISTRRAELQDFVARHAAARVWALANVDTYAGVWSQLMGIPKPVPQRWFERQQVRPVAIDATVIADEQFSIDLYARNGLIPKSFDARSVLDGQFNNAVTRVAKLTA